MRTLIAAATAGFLATATAAYADPVDVSVEAQHDNGASVLIRTMEMTDTEIRLDVRVVNGHSDPIWLAHYNQRTYIDTADETRLMLVRPEDNENLEIPAQSTVEGSLVFIGPTPETGDLLLVLNEPGARRGGTATVPRIDIVVPSDLVEAAALKKN